MAFFRSYPEDLARHPEGGDEDVGRIGEECRFVAFDEVSEPGQGKGGWDQQQGDDPVPSDDDQGGKAYRDGNHV